MLGQKDDLWQELVCWLKAIFSKLVAIFLVLLIVEWTISMVDERWLNLWGVIKSYCWTHGHILPWIIAHHWLAAVIFISLCIYRNFSWLKRIFKCCKRAICQLREQKRDLDSGITSNEHEKRLSKADKDELYRGALLHI